MRSSFFSSLLLPAARWKHSRAVSLADFIPLLHQAQANTILLCYLRVCLCFLRCFKCYLFLELCTVASSLVYLLILHVRVLVELYTRQAFYSRKRGLNYYLKFRRHYASIFEIISVRVFARIYLLSSLS